MGQGHEQTTDLVRSARLDRRYSAFGTLDDDSERAHWRSRSPHERLEAAELLRQVNYGDSAITGRLQRVFEFAELGTS